MQNTDVTTPKGVFARVGAWLRGDRYMVGGPPSQPVSASGAADPTAAREQRDAAVQRTSAELEREREG